MNYESLLSIAIKASIKAGEGIMSVYEGDDFDVEFKGDDSPLTKADKLAHEIIEGHLRPTAIPVLSEEGKSIHYEERSGWEKLWIVDPLDGTKEFIKRNGEFTVNIALVENQEPILGVVYCPALGILYYGGKNIGSFKMNISDVSLEEFDRSDATPLPEFELPEVYTVVASRSHLSDETKEFVQQKEMEHGKVEMISKGSSLKFCMVAEGKAHSYPRFAPTMEWDTAAGHAVCKYAGLTVTDWSTQKEKIYNNSNLLNNWFLVHKAN